ncbi:hypothetical protein LAV84_18365 [Rhizobium sp. VS19-DR104.2]|uniref:hypothetical protein n=1 Tax=unclassified Rhizobium TaxID=2613769 RepID=UPI001CC39D6E|nr:MULTISPECIES: hypothetical protein [unclassified Rhizobium]MBZ5761569.1 hypothetical protein [Rhizobium sp. VS19-DR96]MBZ5767517.1 hypothetical protein [Rhizobium sp. VS19-DR129.2]MBZ5775034.1 hypothetical protein [Rhizobium sp. VS19-DRK62.2]MBZ5786000.1 hypothetical protein [Rhizobium sp. VS19-DR121]MBZ5803427.1 hypothetical protein [Rhizobium sp. VS19-DR181]
MITGKEIGDRFIRSVEVIEKLYSIGPSQAKSAWMDIPYTQADKNGWGSERLADERKAFWNSLKRSPRPWEITEAEETQDWLRHVTSEDERLCLMGWARCMALDGIFKDWCKAEGIHVETGRRRKERAILRILLALDSKPLQHNENHVLTLLPDTPDLGDKDVILENDAPRNWMAEDAKPLACEFDEGLRNFSWAEKQNERRRQREAQNRKKQAA